MERLEPEYARFLTAQVTWPTLREASVTWSAAESEQIPAPEPPPHLED